MADTWFYAVDGEQIGPVNYQEMEELVESGKIKPETKVWNGEGDWTPAKDSELSNLFGKSSDIPPPLSPSDIDNRYVWGIVALPIVGAITDFLFGADYALIFLVLTIAFCVLDAKKLRAAGQKAPSVWWVLLIPVYLWKRATLLGQKQIYFLAWVVVAVLSFYVAFADQQMTIELSACPLVTQIISEQFQQTAVCKSVNITENVSDGFYKATATLDNGNDIKITIEEKEDGMIYVQIPNQ